jgi:hypothetical protein
MKTKQKNNKILPATSVCCVTVVRNECTDHFSINNNRTNDDDITYNNTNNSISSVKVQVIVSVAYNKY